MALIKCPEEDCTKMVSDKAEYCPECGYPIAAGAKKQWEESHEGKTQTVIEERRERRKREDREEKERREREAIEAIKTAKKLETFKEIRDKLNQQD